MTSKHFHKLILRKKIKRTIHASTLEIDVPDDLNELFKFKAGQYLTFRTTVNGEELRRSYSINSSSIADEALQVTVKKVKDGRVSNHFVDTLQAGDTLEVMPPLGQFVLPETIPVKNFFYAAGSGITPIFGLIKTILHSNNNTAVNLQYGNFEREQVIFFDEFEQLKGKFSKRFSITHHFTNAINSLPKKSFFGKMFAKSESPSSDENFEAGDFTSEKLIALSKLHENFLSAEHFICGPGQMIPQLEATLLTLGVPQNHIHHEYFAAADTPKKSEAENLIVAGSSGQEAAKLTVTLDGETQTFELAAGKTILRESMEQGLDVPYACEAGVCATCKAMCLKGKVKLRANNVLSDAELAEGYILTCQAEALTQEVIVDYDQA